ncbi:MAG: ATP-dependent helicase [Proteobacteria bacterium]|nr:ATP-dependent helicase [Pseudomonadota bacterium]
MDPTRINAPAGRRAESFDEELPPLDGAYLVLAGPGTGKTTLLVQRARHVLETKGMEKTKVLALTFTNKAAAEMKTRLNSEIPDSEARTFIGTFHAFGSHVLRAHGHAIGIPSEFVVYDERDQLALLEQLQEQGQVPTGVNLESLVHAFSRLKSRGLLGDLKQDEVPDISVNLRAMHETYRSALRAAGALDFGDLVLECVRLFRERPQVLRLYRVAFGYVLVDEFQDTTPSQYELLQMLVDAKALLLFAVADEDQLIFEWNEARLETLNRVCTDFQAKVIYSTLSHRCPPNIVEAANAVIARNRFRFPGKPEIRSKRTDVEPIRVFEAADENQEASFVVTTVKDLRRLGLRSADIGIIARARRLLDQIEEALVAEGIPAARPSIAGLGGTEEAEAILRLLRWLQNSRDEQSARHLVSVLCPEAADAFESAVRAAREKAIGVEAALVGELPSEDDPTLRALVEHIARWRLLARDTHRLLATLRAELPGLFPDSPENGSARVEAARVLDELERLRQGISTSGRLALPDFLLGLPQLVSAGALVGASSRDGTVSLLTYHQAKGLEFSAVFLTALEAEIFPDFRSERDLRRMEEERRLFYVGITRTKSRLYLTSARQRRTVRGNLRGRDQSSFLGEIPAQLLQRVALAGGVKP